MLQFSGAILQHLIPALCKVIASSTSMPDTRFFCLRMMSDMLAIYLTAYTDCSQDAAGAAIEAAGEQLQRQKSLGQTQPSSQLQVPQALDLLLCQHIVPLVPVLLQQPEPMPLYGLKVRLCRIVQLLSCLAVANGARAPTPHNTWRAPVGPISNTCSSASHAVIAKCPGGKCCSLPSTPLLAAVAGWHPGFQQQVRVSGGLPAAQPPLL